MANTQQKEIDVMPDKTEQFIIKIADLKESMGLWYSLFARIILPFLLFIIPVNVIIGRFNMHILSGFFPGVNFSGTIMLVMWIVAMLVFLAVTVFIPKLATVMEFILGFSYLFLAFRLHLFNNALGYSVLIGMIVFLLVKLVFLVFEIIRIKEFSGDKGNNIERDESGRIVRESKDDVFYNKTKESFEMSESGKAVVAANGEFLFGGENIDNTEPEENLQTDDDFLFEKTDDTEPDDSFRTDDDFLFAKTDDTDNIDGAISDSDNDYFFG